MNCEYVHAPLHRVCVMTVPQLVRVDVESSSTSLIAANISNRLSSEMSLATGGASNMPHRPLKEDKLQRSFLGGF